MTCPICKSGIKPKKTILIPVRDNKDVNTISSYLKLVEGSVNHQKILDAHNGFLPEYLVRT